MPRPYHARFVEQRVDHCETSYMRCTSATMSPINPRSVACQLAVGVRPHRVGHARARHFLHVLSKLLCSKQLSRKRIEVDALASKWQLLGSTHDGEQHAIGKPACHLLGVRCRFSSSMVMCAIIEICVSVASTGCLVRVRISPRSQASRMMEDSVLPSRRITVSTLANSASTIIKRLSTASTSSSSCTCRWSPSPDDRPPFMRPIQGSVSLCTNTQKFPDPIPHRSFASLRGPTNNYGEFVRAVPRLFHLKIRTSADPVAKGDQQADQQSGWVRF